MRNGIRRTALRQDASSMRAESIPCWRVGTHLRAGTSGLSISISVDPPAAIACCSLRLKAANGSSGRFRVHSSPSGQCRSSYQQKRQLGTSHTTSPAFSPYKHCTLYDEALWPWAFPNSQVANQSEESVPDEDGFTSALVDHWRRVYRLWLPSACTRVPAWTIAARSKYTVVRLTSKDFEVRVAPRCA